MNDLFSKKTKKKYLNDNDLLLSFGAKVLNDINPDQDLLARILDRVEIKDVTKVNLIRNDNVEDGRKNLIISPFSNFVNNMNKYIKIISGTAVVSALVLTLIFVNKGDKKELVVEGEQNTQNVQVVEVGGEVLDVDSLTADLQALDSAFDDPVIDDSYLLTDLINTNDYEI